MNTIHENKQVVDTRKVPSASAKISGTFYEQAFVNCQQNRL